MLGKLTRHWRRQLLKAQFDQYIKTKNTNRIRQARQRRRLRSQVLQSSLRAKHMHAQLCVRAILGKKPKQTKKKFAFFAFCEAGNGQGVGVGFQTKPKTNLHDVKKFGCFVGQAGRSKVLLARKREERIRSRFRVFDTHTTHTPLCALAGGKFSVHTNAWCAVNEHVQTCNMFCMETSIRCASGGLASYRSCKISRLERMPICMS